MPYNTIPSPKLVELKWVFVLFRTDAFPLDKGVGGLKVLILVFLTPLPLIRGTLRKNTSVLLLGPSPFLSASVERGRPVYPALICDIKEIPE